MIYRGFNSMIMGNYIIILYKERDRNVYIENIDIYSITNMN